MFARHSLAWLSAHGWRQARAAMPHTRHAMLDAWQQADWPAIVRRADADTPAGCVCLGLALAPDPVDGGKTRIPFQAPVSELTKISQPLRLSAVIADAPPPWRAPLAALQAEAQSLQLHIRVYGSLALQALTRQRYVTSTSDIDLLLFPDSASSLQRGLDLFALHAGGLPLDGEIVFPTGQAVAWKEWRNAMCGASGERVLVKGRDTVSLLAPAALLALLKDASCAV